MPELSQERPKMRRMEGTSTAECRLTPEPEQFSLVCGRMFGFREPITRRVRDAPITN
jgi:hypothetical protein